MLSYSEEVAVRLLSTQGGRVLRMKKNCHEDDGVLTFVSDACIPLSCRPTSVLILQSQQIPLS